MMRAAEAATAMETRDNKAKLDVSKIPFYGWRVPVLRCRFTVAHLHSAVLTLCHEDLLTLVRFEIFASVNIKTTIV
jgi:hypothetical protein